MPRKKKAGTELPKPEESLFEIRKFAKPIAGSVIVQQAEKVVSTPERKMMWFVCDGKLDREQIATTTKIKKRTVDYFIDECKSLGLIEEEKEKGGHPKRVIDYVSEDWKQLAREKLKTPKQQPETPQTS